MEDGTRIEFEGESDQSPDMAAGDVIFIVKQTPHSVFRREGMSLHVNHAITLKEALLGFDTTLSHLDGSKIPLKRTSVTQNGLQY
jgi:DnaJ-related protein SCJ1